MVACLIGFPIDETKNGVVGILEAVESLLEHGIDQLESTVLLAFGHDEEISGKNGAKHIGKLLKSRNTKLDFILDEGIYCLSVKSIYHLLV